MRMRKTATHIIPRLGMTKRPRVRVSMKASFNRGSKSHIKWSIVSGPQKGVRHMKRSCTVVWLNPPPRPLPATGSMPEVS